MRVALFSDIHGNLVALDAVLADIYQIQVDQIVCLGDVPALGPQPRKVLARLRALDCACVVGNHDLHLLDPDSARELGPWITEVTAWCADRLSQADLDFLSSFRPLIEIPLGPQATLLCYHGSPRSSEDRILATTPDEELDRMLDGHSATVMAGGHNHVQMVRRHKGRAIVDVGSVGSPFKDMPFEHWPRFMPWAEYAIVHWVDGVLGIDLRRVPIDLEAVRRAARASDMPDADDWASWWLTQDDTLQEQLQ
jgi:predicted phosphodiesterase